MLVRPKNFDLAIKNNEKLVFPTKESNKSRLVGKLRYWWSWLFVSVLLLLAAPTIVWFRFRQNREKYFDICDWGGRMWAKAGGVKGVDVKGLEHLEDGQQYVFISNHRSYLDTAILFAHAGRRLGLVAKKELLKVPIFGYGLGVANIIAIDRSNPTKARESMDKARQIVNDGYSFGVFAEGTRAMPGELLPFKKGAIHLALQTGIPIIPVAFKNTDELMGKKQGVAHSGIIDMVLLPPIETEGKTAENDLMDLLIESRRAVAEELVREFQES